MTISSEDEPWSLSLARVEGGWFEFRNLLFITSLFFGVKNDRLLCNKCAAFSSEMMMKMMVVMMMMMCMCVKLWC